MRWISRITIVAVFVSCALAHAGPVLLGTIPVRAGLGGEDPVVDQRIEFTLQIQQTPGTSGTGIGSGIFWGDGDGGVVDFTQDDDGAFADFASLVTNGTDELLVFLGKLRGGGGGGGGNYESVWLGQPLHGEGGPPDLLGYNLDFVRLLVEDVDFRRFEQEPGIFIDVQFAVTFELYGAPIPDAETLWLMGIGLFPALARRCTL